MQEDNISSSSSFNIFDWVLDVFFLCVFVFSPRTMSSILLAILLQEDETDMPSSPGAAFLESTALLLDRSDPVSLLCSDSSFGPGIQNTSSLILQLFEI
jgi:hypothetical protein